MSEDQIKQAVVDEPKTPAEPGAEGAGARNDGDDFDLNKFLDEYGKTVETKPAPAAQPEQTGTADVSQLLALQNEITDLRRYVTGDKDKADFVKAAQEIRGDADSELFSNGMIRGWIQDRPRAEIEKIDKIWENRASDPATFKRMIAGFKQEFVKGPVAKLRQLPDANATEDRDAVAHAVRGASTKAPPEKAPDYSKMSPGEFQAEKDRLFGN